MPGFRGHFVTKTRGYFINLGTLRAGRAAYRARQDGPTSVDDDFMPVLSCWYGLDSGTSIRRRASGDQRRVEASLRARERHCSTSGSDRQVGLTAPW
jgi:hypothetical protein